MKYSFYSSAGRIKKVNEDAALLQVAFCGGSLRGMAAVCDGVSSLSHSARSSRLVIACLHRLFEKWKQQPIQPRQELMDIHQLLYEKGQRDHRTYGTTCSLFLFEDDAYQILQVGDSRIYVLQDELQLLTVDQTLARMKYDQRIITYEEYCRSDERHILTQCLGVSKPLNIQYRQGTWRRQDAILVCSDGISNALAAEVLQHHLELFVHEQRHDQAKRLAQKAMAAGERDNLSAVMFTRSEGL